MTESYENGRTKFREIVNARRLRSKQGPMTDDEKMRFRELDSLKQDRSVTFTDDMMHEFEGLYILAKAENLEGCSFDWSNDRGVFISKADRELNTGQRIDPAYGFWW